MFRDHRGGGGGGLLNPPPGLLTFSNTPDRIGLTQQSWNCIYLEKSSSTLSTLTYLTLMKSNLFINIINSCLWARTCVMLESKYSNNQLYMSVSWNMLKHISCWVKTCNLTYHFFSVILLKNKSIDVYSVNCNIFECYVCQKLNQWA